ncbi:MAG TPA: hypothetical protein PLS95_19560, partial [Thermoanaerobaculales bacterium]|nr:hypothetical protein [Thermoanaerobaculales bacterium]
MTLRFPVLAGVLAALAGLAVATAVFAQEPTRFAVELELGPVWQSSNDVQIPDDADGTRFSLVDLAGYGPWPAGRDCPAPSGC